MTTPKATVFRNFTLLAGEQFPYQGPGGDSAGEIMGWVHFTKGGFWSGCALLRTGSVSTGFASRLDAEAFVREYRR